jgi:hypothetical protein
MARNAIFSLLQNNIFQKGLDSFDSRRASFIRRFLEYVVECGRSVAKISMDRNRSNLADRQVQFSFELNNAVGYLFHVNWPAYVFFN